MSSAAAVADVIEAFKQRGFEFVGKTDDGWFRLHGQLTHPKRTRAVHAKFSSTLRSSICLASGCWKFLLSYPQRFLILMQVADFAISPKARSFWISTTLSDSRWHACSALPSCSADLEGEMIEDLTEEFFAYWDGWLCFVDMQGEDLGRQSCIVAQANGNSLWFITDNEDRTTKKLTSLGYQVTDQTVLTYRVKTSAQPRPLTSHWPPKQLGISWRGKVP